MKIIPESGMNFGKYQEDSLFHIEKSKIYKDLGAGIKTVEFVLRYNKNSIVFLEAKKSCPNAKNRYESEEKERKFEEYYSSVTEKFTDSLQIYLAALLDRYGDGEEIGKELRNIHSMRNIRIKFILVVKDAEDIAWLAGPLAELKERLLRIRKIWGIEIAVLNETLAKEYKLLCGEQESIQENIQENIRQ